MFGIMVVRGVLQAAWSVPSATAPLLGMPAIAWPPLYDRLCMRAQFTAVLCQQQPLVFYTVISMLLRDLHPTELPDPSRRVAACASLRHAILL